MKRAVTALQAAYRILWADGIDVSKESIGIEVSIEVTGDAWGTTYPERCIFDELTCTATVVGALSEPLSDEDAKDAFDDAMDVVRGYCADATDAGSISNPNPAMVLDSDSDDDSDDDSDSDGPGAGSRRTREGEGVTSTSSSSKMDMDSD